MLGFRPLVSLRNRVGLHGPTPAPPLSRLCRRPCGKAVPYRAAAPTLLRLRRRPKHLCRAKQSQELMLPITLHILANSAG
jgi:hypothetical protein